MNKLTLTNNLVNIDYGEDLIFVSNLYKISSHFAFADFNSISYNKNYSSMTNITKFNSKHDYYDKLLKLMIS